MREKEKKEKERERERERSEKREKEEVIIARVNTKPLGGRRHRGAGPPSPLLPNEIKCWCQIKKPWPNDNNNNYNTHTHIKTHK